MDLAKKIHGVEVIIDSDKNINYEENNAFNKITHCLSSFLLNLIPPWLGSWLIKVTSKKAGSVKEKATTYYALDTIYTTHQLRSLKLKDVLEYLWFKIGNTKAARNRLKLVKKLLRQTIQEKIKQGEKINFLSLGSGSARAIIEIIAENKINQDYFFINLLDKDEEALNFSRKLLQEYNLSPTNFNFILDKVRNFDLHLKQPANIIEMVGVMDYLKDNDAIDIFRKIYNNLPNDSVFITANIQKNKESKFITKTIKWPMIYREPEDLIPILLASGFKKDKIKISIEPLKIHMVAYCKK